MSWREGDNVGQMAIVDCFNLLRPDAKWVEDSAEGFTWWPGDLGQRIWTDGCLFQHGRSTYLVHVETDLVRGRAHLREEAIGLATKLGEGWLFAGIYDRKAEKFLFTTTLSMVEDQSSDIRQLFRAAAAMQVVEAYDLAKELVVETRASRAISGHKTNGLRTDVDPHLHEVQAEIIAGGQADSCWRGDESDWLRTSWIFEREAQTFQTDKASEIQATFEWDASPGMIEVQVDCNERHGRLGNGLFGTLKIPLRLSPEHTAMLVLEMNEAERSGNSRWQNIGSWAIYQGSLAFRIFVPNWAYHEETLHDIGVSIAARAHWANEFFIEKKRQAAPA